MIFDHQFDVLKELRPMLNCDSSGQVVQEVPEESCSLEPQLECKFVTKLVPLLKPAENCIDIPKEVCSRSRKNPRKISKPVIKKWCYTPTKESGLPPPPPPPRFNF